MPRDGSNTPCTVLAGQLLGEWQQHRVIELGEGAVDHPLELRPIVGDAHQGDDCMQVRRQLWVPDLAGQKLVMPRGALAVVESRISSTEFLEHSWREPAVDDIVREDPEILRALGVVGRVEGLQPSER